MPALQIPVYFLESKYDYTCTISLTQDYFEQLRAPVEGFYEFDRSSHSPLLEQPQQGHRILELGVLAGESSLADLR